MTLIMDQERTKQELEELKIGKNQQIEDKMTTKIVALELKEQGKIEKEIKWKEREQLK